MRFFFKASKLRLLARLRCLKSARFSALEPIEARRGEPPPDDIDSGTNAWSSPLTKPVASDLLLPVLPRFLLLESSLPPLRRRLASSAICGAGAAESSGYTTSASARRCVCVQSLLRVHERRYDGVTHTHACATMTTTSLPTRLDSRRW